MSSKLLRGAGVPAESLAWPRVSAPDVHPGGRQYPAASYGPMIGPGPVGHAPPRDDQAASAREQGFAEGQAAARREAAAQIEAMHLQMARSIEELCGLRPRFRHEAEQDVVALAIAVARRILHRELTVAPEALLGLVKAAFEKLELREVQRVRVSRFDAPQVTEYLQKMGLPHPIEVIADPAFERGAAVLESSRGALDASVETQLAEIERGFADLVRRT
jgi:flagellar assembly protein FliH